LADPVARRVALICGAGQFPLAVAEAATTAGCAVFMVALRGAADPAIAAYPHVWLRLGELGRLLRVLKAMNIPEVCLVGGLVKPELRDLRPDFGAMVRLPAIARLLRGGDNHALTGMIALLEAEGVSIVAAQDLAPGLLAPQGNLTAQKPSPRNLEDVRIGLACLASLSPFDVGQAVVVARRRILALEAVEGTDAMLCRIASLRETGRLPGRRSGVLIKAPKRGQDLRVDMPAIGPATIAAAAQARLEGIALEAFGVLLHERDRLTAEAAAAGLFVTGVAGAP
jgi:DUF1009 family protein